jgi:hypothetical protein
LQNASGTCLPIGTPRREPDFAQEWLSSSDKYDDSEGMQTLSAACAPSIGRFFFDVRAKRRLVERHWIETLD